MVDTTEEWKLKGNEYYTQKNYSEAEKCYTSAIASCNGLNSILYSNRAACRLETGNYEKAYEDTIHALQIDPTNIKAYYRKAIALLRLKKSHKEIYDVWKEGYKFCSSSSIYQKYFLEAQLEWLKYYKIEKIIDTEDLLDRFALLKDSREILSSMAHFWNESTKKERFDHFKFLLTLIGGSSQPAEHLKYITRDMMNPMPLHNYEDLPRHHIEVWCEYFKHCSMKEKTYIFEQIWKNLNTENQHLVIQDLKLFISNGLNALTNQEDEENEDEGDDQNKSEDRYDMKHNDETIETKSSDVYAAENHTNRS